MSKYTALVPAPPQNSINSSLSPLPQSFMLATFGQPAKAKSSTCQPVTAKKLKPFIVTDDVGPFRVTGHKAAIADLKQIFQEVKAENPELYALLSCAGMLCARLVRGSNTSWSNHSFGFAIDIKIGGELDERGDGKVQAGLLELYKYFHRHGWYWGAEYPTEDGMHWEMSLQTLKRKIEEGSVIA